LESDLKLRRQSASGGLLDSLVISDQPYAISTTGAIIYSESMKSTFKSRLLLFKRLLNVTNYLFVVESKMVLFVK